MADYEVGFKKKKKKKAPEVESNFSNAKNFNDAPSNVDNRNGQSSEDAARQRLLINRNRLPDTKAEQHRKKMENRNWFQKLVKYDPDAGWFQNTLSVAFSGFDWLDTSVFSAINSLYGNTQDAQRAFDESWNQGKTYGFSDFATDFISNNKISEWTGLQGAIGKLVGKKPGEHIHKEDVIGKLSEVNKGLGMAASVGSLVTDILGSPTQLALTILTLGASASVSVSGEIGQLAGKSAKLGNTVAKGAKGAKALKVADTIGDTTKFSREAYSLSKTGQSFKSVLKTMQRTGKLPEGIKANSSWNAILQTGKKYNFNKKWLKGAERYGHAHESILAGEKSIKSAVDFGNALQNYGNQQRRAYKFANGAKQALEWTGMAPLKALGLGRKLGLKGLKAYVKSGRKGSVALAKAGEPFKKTKDYFSKLFNKNRNLSQESVSAINQSEELANKLSRNVGRDIDEIGSIVNRFAKQSAKQKVRGVGLSSAEQSALSKIKIGETKLKNGNVKEHTLLDLVTEVHSDKNYRKIIDKQDNFSKAFLDRDPESLKKLVRKPSLSKQSGKFKSNSYEGKIAQLKMEEKLSANQADIAKRVEELVKNTGVSKKVAKETALREALEKSMKSDNPLKGVFSTKELEKMTPHKRAQVLEEFWKKTDIKVWDEYVDKLLERVSNITDPKDFAKLSSLELEIVKDSYRDIIEGLKTSFKGEFNNIGDNLLTKNRLFGGATSGITLSDFETLRNVFSITSNKKEFMNKVLPDFAKLVIGSDGAAAQAFLKQLMSENPKLRDAALLDIRSYILEQTSQTALKDYLSATFTAKGTNKNRKVQATSTIDSLFNRGKYEISDLSSLPEYQSKQLSNLVQSWTDKKMTQKEVRNFLDNVEKTTQEFSKTIEPQLKLRMQELGLRTNTPEEIEAYQNRFWEILKDDHPKYFEALEQQKAISKELDLLAKGQDANTREFVKALQDNIFTPINNKNINAKRESLTKLAQETYEKFSTTDAKKLDRQILSNQTRLEKTQAKVAQREKLLKENQILEKQINNLQIKVDRLQDANQIDKVRKVLNNKLNQLSKNKKELRSTIVRKDALSTLNNDKLALQELKKALDERNPEEFIKNFVEKGFETPRGKKIEGLESFSEKINKESNLFVAQASQQKTNALIKDLDGVKGIKSSTYKPIGSTVNLTGKGQEKLNSFVKTILGEDIEKVDDIAQALWQKVQNAEPGSWGLSKENLEFLKSKLIFSSIGSPSEAVSNATGWMLTKFKSESLKNLSNRVNNLNATVVNQVASELGVDINTLADTSLWFREARNPDNFLEAMEGMTLQPLNKLKVKLSVNNRKILTKTLGTVGVDTNLLVGDRLMHQDPIKSMGNKLDIVYENFKVENLLKTGLESGDIYMVEQTLANTYFNSLEGIKAKNSIKIPRLDKRLATKIPNPLPEGSYLIKASEMVENMDWMKSLYKNDTEYNKFVSNIVDQIKNNLGDKAKGIEDASLLANNYFVLDSRLHEASTRVQQLAKAPLKEKPGIFTKVAKTIGQIWKSLALLSPGYHVRNAVTNMFNHWLTGVPMSKSIFQQAKAAKDLTKWRGILEPFSRKPIKKGISMLIREEYDIMLKSSKFRINGIAKNKLTIDDAIKSLSAKKILKPKDVQLAYEMLDLERKALIGGFNIHADFGALFDTNRALANNMRGKMIKTNGKFATISKQIYEKTLGAVTDMNMRLGALTDDAARLATHRIYRNPKMLEKGGYGTVDEAVRFINLDYQNMTRFEKEKLRIFMPFYTYARQSFAMHFKNAFRNPRGYGLINSVINDQYQEYDDTHDEGLPAWARTIGYIPMQSGTDTSFLKLQLPYQDMINLTNFAFGSAEQMISGSDKYNRSATTTAAKNLFGQINPFLKAGISTAFGQSSFSGQANNGNFFKALEQEVGGVVSRIPEYIRGIVDGADDDTKSIEDKIRDVVEMLFGLTKTYPDKSLENQKVWELLEYLEEEIQKVSGYIPSYERMKERIFGKKIQTKTFLKGKAYKVKKYKKKKPKLLSENKYDKE